MVASSRASSSTSTIVAPPAPSWPRAMPGAPTRAGPPPRDPSSAAAIHDRDLVRARAALPTTSSSTTTAGPVPARVEGRCLHPAGSRHSTSSRRTPSWKGSTSSPRKSTGRSASGARSARSKAAAHSRSFWVDLQKFEHGRFVGLELFEAEHLDVARARFEELRPDPLRIPPNAASRARDRTGAAFAACNWPALRTLVSDDFVFDDRRKIMALTGDVELWIKSQEVVSSSTSGVRVRRDLIGTVGERIAIERVLWTGRGPEGGEFEAEGIMLSGSTRTGGCGPRSISTSTIAAPRLPKRKRASWPGRRPRSADKRPSRRLFRAYRQYDWVGQRASLADDLTFRDHRTLGLLGTLGGDEWVESLRIQADLAPDVAAEQLRRSCLELPRSRRRDPGVRDDARGRPVRERLRRMSS